MSEKVIEDSKLLASQAESSKTILINEIRPSALDVIDRPIEFLKTLPDEILDEEEVTKYLRLWTNIKYGRDKYFEVRKKHLKDKKTK